MATKVETKDMILYAYRIENEELSTGVSDFTANLLKKLESEEEQAGKRILQPSEDSSEADLLSYYVLKRPSRRIFGMMMRIAKVKDISTIPPELLQKVIIKPEELRELDISDKESIVCKNRYYFMVDDNHLVITLQKNLMTQFKTYMNWFLELYRGEKLYKFSNLIETPSDTNLKDIRSITFADNATGLLSGKINSGSGEEIKLISVAKDFLEKIVAGDENLEFLVDKKILSANLVVKFNKIAKKDADNEDIKKALSAIITPLADDDYVSVELKDKRRISAGKMIRKKTVTVDLMDNGAINHEQLSQAMESYLNELKPVER